VKAASPYLSTSQTVLPADLFAELEPGGRIDSVRSAFAPNETQMQQFSEESFNRQSAGSPGTGDPAILDASLEEVLEMVLPAQELIDADNAGLRVDPVSTYNFTATGALASVPGTVPSGDPIVFELNTFIPPVAREEIDGIGESFSFMTNALEQTIGEFVIVARNEDAAAEERIVWLVVLKPVEPGKVIGANGERTQVQLSEEVLDDLPDRVYKRLPDGDYRLYLQEAGEAKDAWRLIIEVQIRDGKPTDIKEEPKALPKPVIDEQQSGGPEQSSDNSRPQGEQNQGQEEEENAAVDDAETFPVVSHLEPGPVSDKDWEMWVGRGSVEGVDSSSAKADQGELETAGTSSLAALAAGSALLSMQRNESWRQEVDKSVVHWMACRKRRPR